MMNISISFIAGLAFGLLLAYLVLQKRRAGTEELRVKLSAGEALLAELRRELEGREKRLEELSSQIISLQRKQAEDNARLELSLGQQEEQKRVFQQSEEKLLSVFQALSGEALKSNNRAFLELAKENLNALMNEAKGEMLQKEESIRNLLFPIQDTLKRYENQISSLEEKRLSAYSSLENQLKSLLESERELQKETGNLVNALRRPEVRGKWGEMALKRVVELSGMLEHCDYSQQVSVDTADGRLRPDMIVHLPAGREIVVDSKVPLDAYLEAVNAVNEEQKAQLIQRHAQQLRKHMRALAEKSYWEQFPKAPEFVLMFIPGESFLAAAMEKDLALMEDGMSSKVIIATPTTLIALLRAIAFGWRQEQITKNAREIADLARELYDRFSPFLKHLNRTGSSLAQSVACFNDTVKSLDTRVLSTLRKFKEMGIAPQKELPETSGIEQIPLQSSQKQESAEAEEAGL